ncbi:MAG: DNA mismatch repair endonuclease MutL [Bdellovibrionaceae bacterium]|nr:DNA mismatch repair endonuclease MutL [Pseudobdellovibrionaceae bacterium]
MSIRVLPTQVIDQIAAGEVVERPAHLVKELVENSLDAGARSLQIDYSEGGRRVKVTDDGGGIAAGELALALERFATSKIQEADDLWNLSSFGFRGEALASLAAVSRLTLMSRRPGEDHAHRLISDFGRKSEVEKVGGPPGTTVLIEDLFANLPARLKFLKSETAEHGQIRTTLKALALSRPDVEFRVHENGRLQAYYPATVSRRERAEQVLGVQPLYEGEAVRESVRAQAVFAAPSDVAKTSRQIWLFVQGRWVQDRGLQAAVNEAYRHLLMHGEFPIAAVWVDADPGEVDVNIHPTKSQVKFREPSLAFRAVQGSLRSRLEEAPWLAPSAFAQAPAGTAPPAAPPAAGTRPAETSARTDAFPRATEVMENLRFEDPALSVATYAKKDFGFGTGAVRDLPRPPAESGAPEPLTNHAPRGHWSSLEVLGQANLTYILCQSANSLVLVDQHAAHERVVFEKLMRAWRGGRIDIQEFLFPLAVDLPPELVEALGLATADLEKLGLTVEVLGPGTVGVKAGPALLKDGVYTAVLEKTAQEIFDRGGSFRFEKIVGDLCATMACHSVVRAGQALSTEQMKRLLQDMDEFPLSSFCPHGRPVSVEMPFTQLEKQFGRIV